MSRDLSKNLTDTGRYSQDFLKVCHAYGKYHESNIFATIRNNPLYNRESWLQKCNIAGKQGDF